LGDFLPALIPTVVTTGATFGLSLLTQTAASAFSANLCSGWLDKDYVSNGCASDGKMAANFNSTNREFPEKPFEFKSSHVLKLD
jgi:hypothetical protein